jgi:hypothetical protein
VEHYAGFDVSLELTSVCIVDVRGEIICEAKVPSDREALIGLLRARELPIARVGLEAGPLSQCVDSPRQSSRNGSASRARR